MDTLTKPQEEAAALLTAIDERIQRLRVLCPDTDEIDPLEADLIRIANELLPADIAAAMGFRDCEICEAERQACVEPIEGWPPHTHTVN